MSAPEFSRIVKLRAITHAPVELVADAEERAALAARFGVVAIERLVAHVELESKGGRVEASGDFSADLVQSCAISSEDFAHTLSEPFAVRFVPLGKHPGEEELEIELETDDLDEIEYADDAFDLGEAVAQTLGLAIDPYAEGPGAEAARAASGLVSDDAPSGPLAAALAALHVKDD